MKSSSVHSPRSLKPLWGVLPSLNIEFSRK
jgi:hypothetical protein